MVLLSAAGRAAKIAGTDSEAVLTGVQLATRPSAFVVAWNEMPLAADVGVERRVRVTGRLAAGVPDKVLRQ